MEETVKATGTEAPATSSKQSKSDTLLETVQRIETKIDGLTSDRLSEQASNTDAKLSEASDEIARLSELVDKLKSPEHQQESWRAYLSEWSDQDFYSFWDEARKAHPELRPVSEPAALPSKPGVIEILSESKKGNMISDIRLAPVTFSGQKVKMLSPTVSTSFGRLRLEPVDNLVALREGIKVESAHSGVTAPTNAEIDRALSEVSLPEWFKEWGTNYGDLNF